MLLVNPRKIKQRITLLQNRPFVFVVNKVDGMFTEGLRIKSLRFFMN